MVYFLAFPAAEKSDILLLRTTLDRTYHISLCEIEMMENVGSGKAHASCPPVFRLALIVRFHLLSFCWSLLVLLPSMLDPYGYPQVLMPHVAHLMAQNVLKAQETFEPQNTFQDLGSVKLNYGLIRGSGQL